MASTTTPGRPGSSSAQKPRSRRNSRPNTPLRRSSRSELNLKDYEGEFPLDAVESKLQEFSDAFKDLEDNFDQMQMVHESLSRFNENFSSFLYGLNMNAFCVDFPEAPVPESFQRAAKHEENYNQFTSSNHGQRWRSDYDAETTFMTNDTSFVNEPIQPAPTPAPKKLPTRGIPRGSSRGGRGQGSGIARGRGK